MKKVSNMKLLKVVQNESGSAMIFAILMLALLTIIGLSASSNTTLELMIAGNDKSHKQAFYFADGANEVGKELIERGIEERGWSDQSGTEISLDKVHLLDKSFYLSDDLGDVVADADNRDATVDFGSGETALVVGSNTRLSTGGAVQMVAGYEGKGKAAASGGAQVIYDIRAQHESPNKSKVKIASQWRHLL